MRRRQFDHETTSGPQAGGPTRGTAQRECQSIDVARSMFVDVVSFRPRTPSDNTPSGHSGAATGDLHAGGGPDTWWTSEVCIYIAEVRSLKDL